MSRKSLVCTTSSSTLTPTHSRVKRSHHLGTETFCLSKTIDNTPSIHQKMQLTRLRVRNLCGLSTTRYQNSRCGGPSRVLAREGLVHNGRSTQRSHAIGYVSRSSLLRKETCISKFSPPWRAHVSSQDTFTWRDWNDWRDVHACIISQDASTCQEQVTVSQPLWKLTWQKRTTDLDADW